jgi:hypothetical protein
LTPTPILDRLFASRFRDVKWGVQDKPVLIADGQVLHIRKLDSRVRAHAAYAVGTTQRDFDRLMSHLRVDTLRLYEMRVPDLSTLTHLEQLTTLVIEWNTKVTSLQAVGSLVGLKTLAIVDTPKVRDLSPIAGLSQLIALDYSGGIWNKNVANDLEPIGRLAVLEELRLTNLQVLHGGLRPLAHCRALRRLELSNQFPTADYAYLSVAMPDAECDHFAPYIRFEAPIGGKDVMVVGSRKPFLNSRTDAVRLQRYVDDYHRQQERFAADL